MATPQEELERLNKEIAELRKQLGDFTEFIPLQNLKDAQRLFVQLKRETNSIGDSLDYVTRSFRDSVRELSRQNTELGATKTALRSISSISNKILSTRSLEGEISEKELSVLEKKADLQFRSLKIAIDSGRLQGEALSEAQSALKIQEEFFTATQSIRKEQSEINRNAGVKLFSGLQDITQAIPGLRKFTSGISEASIAAKEQARFNKEAFNNIKGLTSSQISQNKSINAGIDRYQKLRTQGIGVRDALEKAKVNAKQIKVGKLPVSSITPFKAGIQSIGPALQKALGPLALLAEVVKTFARIDNITGNIAKNLGISYQTSLGVTRQFNQIALSSDSLFVTTESLAESFVSINKALGTNSSISNEILQTRTELVKQAGYSNEAATQLSILSLATGDAAKDITTEFLGQVTLLNAQNNLAINEKQLLESIATISKGTLATFSSQTGELANAAFEARRLGLTLAQIEGIADGLLDIESSIAAEFEAEVISGRQISLERARLFALNNDLAGVARELRDQEITRESFAKSNRLQQQAIAKALGLSRDELGQMLIEQEALTKLQGTQGETAQERFNKLVQEVGLEQAKAQIGDRTLANQLASVSVQEKFNAAIGKLQQLFVNLVDPLLPVLDIFSEILVIVGKIIKFLDPVIGTLTGAAIGFATGGPVGALIGGLTGVISDVSRVQDGIAPSSKGPFTITDKFGEMAVTAPGDALFASPNVSSQTITNVNNITPNVDSQVNSNLLLDSIKGDIQNIVPQVTITPNTENNTILREIRDRISNIVTPQPTIDVPSPIINNNINNVEGNTLLREIRDRISNMVTPQPTIEVKPSTINVPTIPKVDIGDNILLKEIKNNLNNLSIPSPQITNQVINNELPQPTPVIVNNTNTLGKEDRNINTTVTLTEKDIRAIANAVREGAMEGTSKANVQAVISNRTVSQLSTRIQPELAVNTYKSAY